MAPNWPFKEIIKLRSACFRHQSSSEVLPSNYPHFHFPFNKLLQTQALVPRTLQKQLSLIFVFSIQVRLLDRIFLIRLFFLPISLLLFRFYPLMSPSTFSFSPSQVTLKLFHHFPWLRCYLVVHTGVGRLETFKLPCVVHI